MWNFPALFKPVLNFLWCLKHVFQTWKANFDHLSNQPGVFSWIYRTVPEFYKTSEWPQNFWDVHRAIHGSKSTCLGPFRWVLGILWAFKAFFEIFPNCSSGCRHQVWALNFLSCFNGFSNFFLISQIGPWTSQSSKSTLEHLEHFENDPWTISIEFGAFRIIFGLLTSVLHIFW